MHSNHCNFTSFISKKNCFRSCSIFSVPFWVSCLLSVLMEEIKHGTALFMCLIWGQGIHIAIVLNAPWLWRHIHLNRTGGIGRYQFLLISNLCHTVLYALQILSHLLLSKILWSASQYLPFTDEVSRTTVIWVNCSVVKLDLNSFGFKAFLFLPHSTVV